jgi:hypothetical protein
MHTNRGTCQVCGRVQAIDNGSGITAKHGYLVAGYGFFNGVCPGARHVPAEKSLTVTHAIIAQLEEAAAAHDAEAAAYADGSVKVTSYEVYDATLKVTKRSRHGTYQTTGGYRTVEITAETPAHVVEAETHKAIAVAARNARYARSHVGMMRKVIVPRLGQDLYPAAEVIKAERKVAKAKAVEGVRFPTKVARKDALDKLNRRYEKCRRVLQDTYLAGDRGEVGQTLYYAAQQLNHWRPAHSEQARKLYPQLEATIAEIEALVAEREAVKTAL